jgi:hypothetical protein
VFECGDRIQCPQTVRGVNYVEWDKLWTFRDCELRSLREESVGQGFYITWALPRTFWKAENSFQVDESERKPIVPGKGRSQDAPSWEVEAVRGSGWSPVLRLIYHVPSGVGQQVSSRFRISREPASEPLWVQKLKFAGGLPDEVAATSVSISTFESVTHISLSLMLPTRLLRSACPLPRLLSHQPAASWRSMTSSVRLSQRLHPDSVTNTHDTPRGAVTFDQEATTSLTFACKFPERGERTSHMFLKRACHRGIAIIKTFELQSGSPLPVPPPPGP